MSAAGGQTEGGVGLPTFSDVESEGAGRRDGKGESGTGLVFGLVWKKGCSIKSAVEEICRGNVKTQVLAMLETLQGL